MRTAGMLVFTAVFLAAAAAQAGSSEATPRLTEETIAAFLQEMRTVSMGERNDMLPGDIDGYLHRHLSPEGNFHSKTIFRLPGYPVQETGMKIGTEEFIDNVLDGKDVISDYRTSLEIRRIKIAGNGRSASVETASADSGKMPWPGNDGGEKMIPIEGSSECTQKIGLSPENVIRVEEADCVTVIRFLPFDKPLGD